MKGSEERSKSAWFGTLGAAMEWYDFTLYVYLAPVISQLFFPSDNSLDSLLATFGVFAAGYLMRPLGAAILGDIGDTRGRKFALGLSISVMALGMLLTGLLPTEASIGALAPILLVLIRMAQGFSLGGEFSGSIVLLAESAKPRHRGFTTNLVQISTGIGFLLSSATVAILHALLDNHQMDTWGWRLPFFIGAAIGVVALVLLITKVPIEDPEEKDKPDDVPLKTLFENERAPLIINFLLNGHQALIYYVVATFIPTFVTSILGGPPQDGLFASALAAIVFMALCPPAGSLSDRYGRRPILAIAAVLMAIAAVPLFALISKVELPAVIGGQLGLMVLVVLFTSPALVIATELFSRETRYSGVAVGYNLGATLFGGTAPLVCTALISITGWNLSPGLLLAVGSILVLIVIHYAPETAPVRTGEGSAPSPGS
ncbi:MAG: MFS transporter [Solirubrobacterales bacterium]|nr:MFS transporter [Solirubrobacterales bacterium]MCB0860843.1 MFS transporter [Solirubrobacterales bacterium]HRV59829.1 MFS transporter [Solirubrobacterales bacterium]